MAAEAPLAGRLSGAAAAVGHERAAPTLERQVPVRAIIILMAVVGALLLGLPGQTVTTKYLDHLFVILDGAYRVMAGQAPGRDFHTPLGPLAFYVPAAGHWLSGSLGGAMPVGMALLLLALAPAMAHVLASRLHPFLALPLGAFLVLLLAAPVNLGESVTALSFAMFYNRIGWAALAVLLVMYLRPRQAHPRQDIFDACAAAFLTAVMLYTKITYGLVALAFLVLLLLDPRQRRWAALAIGLTLAAAIVVEGFWRASLAHLADLMLTAKVSGSLRGTSGQIIDHVLGNLADYVLLALFAALALARTRSLRDALFYVFCAVSGFLIINQNQQAWGILTIHAASAVAAETIIRASRETPEPAFQPWSAAAGAKLLFLALVLPTVVHSMIALGLHGTAASLRWGQEVALPNLGRVRLVNLWSWGDHEAAEHYLETVRDGAAALASLPEKPSRILVLDRANPFSVGFGYEPPCGDSAGLLWGRTLDSAHFIPADQLMAGVQAVMEPKPSEIIADPEAAKERGLLRAVYASGIAAAFSPARETKHWIVHVRREPLTRTGCAAQPGGSTPSHKAGASTAGAR